MWKNMWLFGILFMLNACASEIQGPGDENLPNLRALTSEENSLASSSGEFVFELFKELDQQKNGNLFFSPLSVQYALSMTLNGADGETLDRIRETLGVESLNEQEINEAYQSLTDFLLNVDQRVLLTIANSIWYEKQLTVAETFRQAMQRYYDAEIAGLDFKSQEAVHTINDWVNTKTNGLIDKLIESIPDEAVMYLVNAIYFKADWRYQFDEEETKEGPFHLENGSEVLTPFMHSDELKLNYFENTTAQMVEIPYGNGQYLMTVLLPAEGKKTNDILQVLNDQTMREWNNQLDSTDIKLIMPKFKIEFKVLLNDALADMGMGIAFTDQADFTRLFNEQLGLMISKVIHKAVIEVNEEGTEAAAVTGVEVSLTSLPPEKPVLKLDRPFIFFIKEKHSGAVLFAGKLSDPSSDS